MNNVGRLLLAALLSAAQAAAFAGSSGLVDEAAVDKTLIHLEHVWVRALEEHDVPVLQRILADDFIDTSYRGRLRTKADLLAGRVSADIASERLSELKVRVFGNTAVVTGLNTVTGTKQAWAARVRFTDVFVRRNGRWQAVSAQETLYKPAAD